MYRPSGLRWRHIPADGMARPGGLRWIQNLPVSGSSPQTISVGQATETDSAQAVTVIGGGSFKAAWVRQRSQVIGAGTR